MRVRQLSDSPIYEKFGEVPPGAGHGPTAVGAHSCHEEEPMRATTLHVIPSRLAYAGRHLSWTTGDAGCRRRVAGYRWVTRGDSHWRAVIQLPTTTNNIREQLGRRL